MFVLLWKVSGSVFSTNRVDYKVINSDNENDGVEEAKKIAQSFKRPKKEHPCSAAKDFVLIKVASAKEISV